MNSGICLLAYSQIRAGARAFLLLCLVFTALCAQDRLVGPLNLARRVALRGQRAPQLARYDQGQIEASFRIHYATLLLRPSGTQQADLDRLLRDQQDRSSTAYHRWLTPEQFGDRFGLSSGDIATLSVWLKSQGLEVHDVARGRHWITFSGAASDINRAFQTEIHRYRINGKDHFANAVELSIPAAFDSVVAGIQGLNNLARSRATPARPAATDKHGAHQLAPADLAMIYDVNPLYAAGIDGTGQSIAIVGSSDIFPQDIAQFRSQFKLPVNNPQVITFGPDPGLDFGSLFEANLDLEWSGAMAPKAQIIYVNAYDIFLAAQYAIDTNVAPILSMSAGFCEPEGTPAARILGQQANAQGITWMASSGDSGAAGCEIQDDYFEAGKGLAVNIPASLPEVTAVGGTTFNEGDGNYWATKNGIGLLSALSYIPEVAWNDTSKDSVLGSTGGGRSIYFQKPPWQTGPGVAGDGARDVPDISLSASADHDPYLVTFLGSSYAVGGTSASSPAFAGMVALLNQYLQKQNGTSGGLGNINPTLYRLAQTDPTAFHDVTGGDNIVPCIQATPNCVSGSLGYRAGPGYDQATGLGSVDLNELVTHWKVGPASTTSLIVSPGTTTVDGGAVQLTATVKASGGTPSGTVSFGVPDTPLGTAPLIASGDKAIATLSLDASQIPLGKHEVTAVYDGNMTWDGSAATSSLTIMVPQTGAAVAPSVTPNPVLQSVPDSKGNRWIAKLYLSEEAGVSATVTGLSVNGVSYDAQLGTVFKTTTIPPHQTISGSLGLATMPSPATQTLVFTGTDVNGGSWTARTSAQFVPDLLVAARLTIASTPVTVTANGTNGSCQWLQQLTIQNQGGYFVNLLSLYMDATDLTGRCSNCSGQCRSAHLAACKGICAVPM